MSLSNITQVLKLTRLRTAEGHIGFGRQVFEMIWLRLFYGIGVNYYHTARFWRRDLPWAIKTKHLGSSQYRQLVRELNPELYRKISQNKLSEKGLLALFNIPSTKYLGYFCREIGCTWDGNSLVNAHQLENFLQSIDGDRVCFKPVEGWAGYGFSAVELVRTSDVLQIKDLKSQNIMPLPQFISLSVSIEDGQGWIIEEYFQQHTLLQELNPSSLNTLRVWVVRGQLGDGSVVGAFLRLGRQGAVVDNQVGKRIVANVELDTGRLNAASDGSAELTRYETHPDSEVLIEGIIVPHWEDIKALCVKTLKIFPAMHFAGIDIAIGPRHPVVVELNVYPDKEGAAFMDIAPGICLKK